MTEIYDKIKGHAVTESNETYLRSLPRKHQDPSKWVSRETMERAHAAQSNAEPDDHEHWLLIQTEECLKTLGWDGSEDPPREEWARNLASEIEDMRAALADLC
jgi:hypothetical protein